AHAGGAGQAAAVAERAGAPFHVAAADRDDLARRQQVGDRAVHVARLRHAELQAAARAVDRGGLDGRVVAPAEIEMRQPARARVGRKLELVEAGEGEGGARTERDSPPRPGTPQSERTSGIWASSMLALPFMNTPPPHTISGIPVRAMQPRPHAVIMSWVKRCVAPASVSKRTRSS